MSSLRRFCGKAFEAFESAWDTEYFGVPSAKAVLKGNVSEDERVILKDFLSDFEFVTITNLDNNPFNNIWIGMEISPFLTDINVQFVKYLPDIPLDEDDVADAFEFYPRNDRVLEISRMAFKYSRFFNDPRLPADKAKDIYAHWVEGAFEKPSRFFTVASRKGEIAGFLLFSMDEAALLATIELIAVDAVYRGHNVGRSLITGMESLLHKKGIGLVKVGTQINNVAAIRFYTACGFKYENCNAVFHYWPQNKSRLGA